MKKSIQKIISVLLIVQFVFPAWATGLDKLTKREVKNEAGVVEKTVWLFNGFDFGAYEKETDGLEGIIKDEIEVIRSQSQTPYQIIGHSQGGLRVLAYTNLLKKEYPDDYIKPDAIVTVSGVDKGLKALEGNLGPIKSKLQADVNIVWNGMKSIVAIFPLLDVIVEELSFIEGVAMLGNTSLIMELLLSFFPDYLSVAIKENDRDQIAQIRDMIPKSQFIKDNIVETKSTINKVQTGTRQEIQWRTQKAWIFTIWYPVVVTVPVYSYFTRYYDDIKLDPDLWIGYIVGLNNDTLSMLPDNGEWTESDVRGLLEAFAAVSTMSAVIHAFKCATLWGLFTGSPVHMVNSGIAADWGFNIQREIDDLLGATEHDGLVAKESQFYPSSIHNRILGENKEGFLSMPKENHASINPSSNGNVYMKALELTTQRFAK